MDRLSVVVITYNEECKIRRCLEPVRWADEIIVVDSDSTDRTADIAREYTDKVYLNPWIGFAAQRTFGMERATGDWVLFLDADEYVTDSLNARIRRILTDGTDCDGFKIHRMEHFLGYPIRYGTFNPSYQPRLLRRGRGYWTGGAHAHFEVSGKMGILEEDLYHDSHKTLSDFITRINAYTTIDARERHERGQRVGRVRILFSPIGMWWKCLIVKRGYRDGFPGLLLSVGMGMYSFLRLVKVWQLNQAQARPSHRQCDDSSIPPVL